MRRGGPIARRTGLRRSGPLRARSNRPDPSRVEPAEASHVLARDGWLCILSVLVPDHRCAGGISLDHVPCAGRNAMGKRANGDRFHLASVCREANVEGDVSALRGIERDHIERHEGPHHHDDAGATIPGEEPDA
jgi:hypothetical protein